MKTLSSVAERKLLKVIFISASCRRSSKKSPERVAQFSKKHFYVFLLSPSTMDKGLRSRYLSHLDGTWSWIFGGMIKISAINRCEAKKKYTIIIFRRKNYLNGRRLSFFYTFPSVSNSCRFVINSLKSFHCVCVSFTFCRINNRTAAVELYCPS